MSVDGKVTRALARFATNATLSDFRGATRRNAQHAIMDCLGCALAGSREPVTKAVARGLPLHPGRATVIGGGLAEEADAAVSNGAAAHAIGYDDVSHRIHGHPSVVLLPAVLAVSETEAMSQADLLLAYLVGFEVSARTAAAMSPRFFDQMGWHPTSPLGVVGATAGVAHLLRLDEAQTTMALSLAASQASGLRQSFGSMTKFLHAGLAARNAICAARLVQAGATSAEDAIEGAAGFVHAFSGGADYDLSRALAGLDDGERLADEGIQIKRYPCCGEMHGALDVLFELIAEARPQPGEIDQVTVLLDFDPPRSLIHPEPADGLEAKFSLEYCVAASLLDGALTLASFADDRVHRPEIAALRSRIRKRRNPGYEGRAAGREAETTVAIRFMDGGELRRTRPRPPSGIAGVDEAGIERKFRDCASVVLEAAGVERLIEVLSDLEKAEPVSVVTALLRVLGDAP